MASQKETKRIRCFSEGDIREVANQFLLRRDLSLVPDEDVNSETSESGSESSDDEEKRKKIEEEKKRLEEEMEIRRQRLELLKQKEKKKKKKQQKNDQIPLSNHERLDSSKNRKSTPRDKVKFTLGDDNNTNKCSSGQNNALQERRGLVIVCFHSKFTSKSHPTLSSRPSAASDLDMMDNVWKKYGCEVLGFCNEGNNFYEEDLVKKIEEKLDTMPSLDFFAFVLSTHGEEKEEKIIGGDANYQHYFYSKDGQIHTQTLMNAIADIEGLQDKVKMFFIQACRSRANTENDIENHDQGFVIAIKENISKGIGLQPKNNTEVNNSSKGITMADAKGYMPPEDDESLPEIVPVEEDKTIEDEIKSAALFPHCEDSIVMFSSMSGKVAYRLDHATDEGGWLIKALNDELQSYKTGDEIFILDTLTEVNRRVSEREAELKKNHSENIEHVKAQSCFLHNISEELYLKRE